ncbi:hypothetical protein CANCADRAFT_389 [Tortispora caseinolytica NRRL Y-17796]|uniref:Major facilitator superfamily (MFS) profile domain-containing protein n=1 Tax=Tortispora caseinolytica NRRL Y-17796 TaxID=767744 RepID=A0A1E4TJB2_9ASCO|nr:hypothetical protein CANCADRAFT_389 [Tortispora caseinolytica NRRL Y-17796]
MHIDRSAIPGTIHLIDENGNIKGKHLKDIVLSPTPSDDPNDPLNWERKRKYMHMFCIVVYIYALGVPSAAVYSIIVPVAETMNLSADTLNTGTGYMFLFFGLGCLFWQPLAQQYGKRPVYVFSCLATTLIILWAPHAKSSGQWLGGKILQGFLGAPVESLLEISVSDIWFEHERGTWIGVYGLALITSNFAGPLVAGFIADGMGWPWVIYWCSIFGAVSTVWLFLFMEETNWSRTTIAPEDEIIDDESETAPEKSGPVVVSGEVSEDGELESSDPVKKPKTFWQKLKMFDHKRPFMLWTMAIQPVLLVRFPGIVWAGFMYGSGLIWFNVLNATASLILSAPPYNFKASIVGLAYIATLIGCLIVYFWAGYMSDWIRIYFARRNNGVSEPEHRLWSLLPFMIIAPAALILWGVGAAHNIHWIGLMFAMGMLGGIIILTITAPVNYVVDCYREGAAPALVLVIVIRNSMSFGMGYGITPWIEGMGYQNTFITAAFVCIACTLTFIVMVFVGKKSRIMTKDAYWDYVQKMIDNGMAH